jgi:hypothetical protein
MDKTKLAEVIPVLIERLQAAPDGYDITTAQLMQVAGYRLEDFEFMDLFDIHFRSVYKELHADRETGC